MRKPKEICRCGHTREQHNRAYSDGVSQGCSHCTEHLTGCAYFWQAIEDTSDATYVVCPYCGDQAGDAWEWCIEEGTSEIECDECGKSYLYWAEHSVEYCAAPKLNENGSDANGVIGQENL